MTALKEHFRWISGMNSAGYRFPAAMFKKWLPWLSIGGGTHEKSQLGKDLAMIHSPREVTGLATTTYSTGRLYVHVPTSSAYSESLDERFGLKSAWRDRSTLMNHFERVPVGIQYIGRVISRIVF
jgi:hypothetical protein